MRIAITGTPGTGKTTVSRELAKQLKWEWIDLNALARRHSLYSGHDKERDVPIVDVDAVRKRIDPAKENLILESHYAHDMPVSVRVVLRCDPAELKQRLKKKKFSAKKIDENIQAEIFNICGEESLEHGTTWECDTTGKRVPDVVREIRAHLKL